MTAWIKTFFALFARKQAEAAPVTIEPLAPEVSQEFIPTLHKVSGPDRSGFYAVVRKELGKLSVSQVDGFETLFAVWDDSKLTDKRWFAYMLATSWHETAFTMKPIREMGGEKYLKSKKYYPYYGRGYVQLTWKYNYERYGIANDMDRALEPELAAHIMVDGMTKGIFTGKRLSDYFNARVSDPVGARRIINGTDKAVQIAKYHNTFFKALAQIPAPVVVQAPA